MCVAFFYPTPRWLNGLMDRAIVRHVLWDVHATGTWKPPLAVEGDDNYTEEEGDKDEVSGFHFTL